MTTSPSLTSKELKKARAQFSALKEADPTWASQSKVLFKHAFKIDPELKQLFSFKDIPDSACVIIAAASFRTLII